LPALPQPKYPITSLYLFKTYQTREEYQADTGQEPPAWNPYRQPKTWFDPKAKLSPSRKVVYEHALATDSDTGSFLLDSKGRPYLDALVLDRDEAATVNIPPRGMGMTNVPGADVPEVVVPMRALEPNEELFVDVGGLPMVKNTDLYPKLEVGFTQADRDLLAKIARKLGVE
jgi:hypothetical protein